MKFNKNINMAIYFVQAALLIAIVLLFIDHTDFKAHHFWKLLLILEIGFIVSNFLGKPSLFKTYDIPSAVKKDALTLLGLHAFALICGIILVGTETLILTIPLLAVELVRTVIVHISCKS